MGCALYYFPMSLYSFVLCSRRPSLFMAGSSQNRRYFGDYVMGQSTPFLRERQTEREGYKRYRKELTFFKERQNDNREKERERVISVREIYILLPLSLSLSLLLSLLSLQYLPLPLSLSLSLSPSLSFVFSHSIIIIERGGIYILQRD